MNQTESIVVAPDGTLLCTYEWAPPGAPRAVVQIVHGASEHAGRYRRLAQALTDAGYAAIAHDQRGHGRTATEFGALGVARPGGWSAMVDDVHVLTGHARSRFPGAEVVLLGHSMGAAVVQCALPSWGGELAGAVLSGPPALGEPSLAAPLVAAGAGDAADLPSEPFAELFAAFNGSFAAGLPPGASPTGFEWLSRDDAEVRAYVDDPLCGSDAPLSNGFVADMFVGAAQALAPERLARIPKDLPLLVVAGDQDAAAGCGDGVRALVDGYRALGLERLELHLYEGARHEVFNEVNRDAVLADVLAWLDATVA